MNISSYNLYEEIPQPIFDDMIKKLEKEMQEKIEQEQHEKETREILAATYWNTNQQAEEIT